MGFNKSCMLEIARSQTEGILNLLKDVDELRTLLETKETDINALETKETDINALEGRILARDVALAHMDDIAKVLNEKIETSEAQRKAIQGRNTARVIENQSLKSDLNNRINEIGVLTTALDNETKFKAKAHDSLIGSKEDNVRRRREIISLKAIKELCRDSLENRRSELIQTRAEKLAFMAATRAYFTPSHYKNIVKKYKKLMKKWRAKNAN